MGLGSKSWSIVDPVLVRTLASRTWWAHSSIRPRIWHLDRIYHPHTHTLRRVWVGHEEVDRMFKIVSCDLQGIDGVCFWKTHVFQCLETCLVRCKGTDMNILLWWWWHWLHHWHANWLGTWRLRVWGLQRRCINWLCHCSCLYLHSNIWSWLLCLLSS